ncbi:MAG: hypothetical protein ACK4YU_02110, partial [Paracoccus sp. (in: a-proteobacteria)]
MAPDTLTAMTPAPALTAPALAAPTGRPRPDRAAALRIMGLATAEIAALILAAAAVAMLSPGNPPSFFLGAGIAVAGVRAVMGLCPGHGLHPHEILRRSVVASLIALAISAGLPALQGQPAHARVVTEFLLIALPLQYLGRIAAIRLLHGAGLWAVPVHVIGEAHLRQPIEAFFRHHLSYGLA